jgi:hypothetical protein
METKCRTRVANTRVHVSPLSQGPRFSHCFLTFLTCWPHFLIVTRQLPLPLPVIMPSSNCLQRKQGWRMALHTCLLIQEKKKKENSTEAPGTDFCLGLINQNWSLFTLYNHRHPQASIRKRNRSAIVSPRYPLSTPFSPWDPMLETVRL